MPVINKNINQQRSDTSKKFDHRAGIFSPDKCMGVIALYAFADGKKRKQGNSGKNCNTAQQRYDIILLVALVQEYG